MCPSESSDVYLSHSIHSKYAFRNKYNYLNEMKTCYIYFYNVMVKLGEGNLSASLKNPKVRLCSLPKLDHRYTKKEALSKCN